MTYIADADNSELVERPGMWGTRVLPIHLNDPSGRPHFIITMDIKTKILCKIFGWHNGKGEKSFDGMSIHSTCSRCGKKVMQDSQGNWF